MKAAIHCSLLVLALLAAGCATAPGSRTAPRSLAAPSAKSGRMVTYDADIRLESKNIQESQRRVMEAAVAVGGFITKDGTAFSIVRVPAGRLNEFLEAVRPLGKLTNVEINGTDITDEYSDVVLRLESQKKVRDKYLQLLEKATSVQDMLALEKELERVNFDIERLEGRKKASEQRVEYATVNIWFSKLVTPGPAGWIFWGLYKAVEWLFVWK
jgi:hypothetical protein